MKTRKSAQVTNNKKLKSLEKSFKAVVQINAKNKELDSDFSEEYYPSGSITNNDMDIEEDSLFSESDVNEDFCFECKDQGKLICCDNCFKAFHLSCLDLRKTPGGKWQCPFCDNSVKTNCIKCNKNRESAIRITCSMCYRIFDLDCIDVPLELILNSPLNENFFNDETINTNLAEFKEEFTVKNGRQVWNQNNNLKRCEELRSSVAKLNKSLQCFYHCDTCIYTYFIETVLDSMIVENTELEEKNSNDDSDINKTTSSLVDEYFFIKTENSSFIHSIWASRKRLENKNKKKLKNFLERIAEDNEYDPSDALFDLDCCKIDRVLTCKIPLCYNIKNNRYQNIFNKIFNEDDTYERNLIYGGKNNYKYLIKWNSLNYDNCTWEDEYIVMKYKDKLRLFLEIKIKEENYLLGKLDIPHNKEKSNHTRNASSEKHKINFDYLKDKKLYNFQYVGVQWLCNSWKNQDNVILADEMGLGKTIQTLSFLSYLYHERQVEGPFLVMGPASTLLNWMKECNVWCSEFNVIVYLGNQESREIIRRKEFFYNKKVYQNMNKGNKKRNNQNLKSLTKFNLIITSYEMAIADHKFFRKIAWEVLIVDEAHRLKNNESKLFKLSLTYPSNFKILLTGTPLQNNIMELINLIEFLNPGKANYLKNIDSLKVFMDINHNEKDKEKQIENLPENDRKKALTELTHILIPHILRRTKDEVKIQIPEFEEIIVKVSLTEQQKLYYKNVLLKNYEFLKNMDTKNKSNSKVSILNLLNNLRLICNHPLLFLHRHDFPIPPEDKFKEEFINPSNKLKFVERVIQKLLDTNHKILIFSQYTMMLDILCAFLDYKRWGYERLDGKTKILERQKIIDEFNNDNSSSKIFLLSTKAGGLGINLTSADTIIFVDSDFNPYRDIQAISRAHRIGQKNKVKVLRLASKYTAEEKIIEVATKKLLLEEIIINPINRFNKDDLETMLKSGSINLFNKNMEEKEKEFTDEQIDALINRDRIVDKNEDMEVKGKLFARNDLNDFYLSGFKFQSLSFQSYNDHSEKENNLEEKNKYWETLLGNEAVVFQEHKNNEFGKGKRVRRAMQNKIMNEHESDGDDSSYEMSDKQVGETSEVISSLEKSEKTSKNAKERKELEKHEKRKELEKYITTFFEGVSETSTLKSLNDLTKEQRFETLTYNFDELRRREFLSFVLSYGMFFENPEIFWINISKNKVNTFGADKPKFSDFKSYMKEFYYIVNFYEQYPNNIIFCGLEAELVYKRLLGLILLRKKYYYFVKRSNFFKIGHKDYSRNTVIKGENPHVDEQITWTNYDDFLLIKGVFTCGYDNWRAILEEKGLWGGGMGSIQNIFIKLEKREFVQSEEEKAKIYVEYYLKSRANQLLLYMLDREFMREDSLNKKKQQLNQLSCDNKEKDNQISVQVQAPPQLQEK